MLLKQPLQAMPQTSSIPPLLQDVTRFITSFYFLKLDATIEQSALSNTPPDLFQEVCQELYVQAFHQSGKSVQRIIFFLFRHSRYRRNKLFLSSRGLGGPTITTFEEMVLPDPQTLSLGLFWKARDHIRSWCFLREALLLFRGSADVPDEKKRTDLIRQPRPCSTNTKAQQTKDAAYHVLFFLLLWQSGILLFP